jgi:hypothetical protein
LNPGQFDSLIHWMSQTQGQKDPWTQRHVLHTRVSAKHRRNPMPVVIQSKTYTQMKTDTPPLRPNTGTSTDRCSFTSSICCHNPHNCRNHIPTTPRTTLYQPAHSPRPTWLQPASSIVTPNPTQSLAVKTTHTSQAQEELIEHLLHPPCATYPAT